MAVHKLNALLMITTNVVYLYVFVPRKGIKICCDQFCHNLVLCDSWALISSVLHFAEWLSPTYWLNLRQTPL